MLPERRAPGACPDPAGTLMRSDLQHACGVASGAAGTRLRGIPAPERADSVGGNPHSRGPRA